MGGDDWVRVRPPAEEEEEEEPPLKVVFASPAEHFTDAAPIGNGRLGAMVWGGVAAEKLQLNHDTLWTGVPGNYTDPKAPPVLAEVRELVDKGQYVEATSAAYGLLDKPTEVYQPLGDINLYFGELENEYTSYKRELDLHTATVNVTCTIGEVEYTREHFVSNPHQVIAVRISASKSGCVSFTVSLDSQLHHHNSVTNANEIIMEGSCPGKRIPPKENVTDDPSGTKFSTVLGLQMGGTNAKAEILNDTKKLKISNADWVVLLIAASSSFEGPFIQPSDSKLDPTSAALNTLNLTRNMPFSQLKASHLDDYQSLFHRVNFRLQRDSNDQMKSVKLGDVVKPTAERVKNFRDDEDPSLVELLFQYGRYLLISCSRPGTQVSNLQGIWNEDVQPAWDASPHLNINLQMNYWPALPCNLSECQEPLFDLITNLVINGSKTAKVNYQASGWVTHHVSDIWAKTSPYVGDPKYSVWPMGAAWLCTHLWEHYKFSMDKTFLENTAYPLLEGCASFLVDWLIEGRGGYLETNPSTSPEHSFIAPNGETASVSYSTTMDMSIIREVFSAVISSAEVLGKSDTDLIEKIKKALPRIPPIKIARDGTVMEWAQDFEDPEIHHRHLSHLFGLYPGHTITLEKTPEICKAVANSLHKRGEDGPGWSTTWKMALWAHLHDSEHAYRMVLKLITLVAPGKEVHFEGGLYSNLFTAHPPFQIDANFGFTAAIAEMLVQSTEHDLYLLPALPRDKWPSGCVKGLKARGNMTVNICWKEGKLEEALLWSNNQNSLIRLHYGGQVATVTISAGCMYQFCKDLKCMKTRPLDD